MIQRVGADLIRGHLDGLLLAVLAEAPGHGYELGQRLTQRSGGALGVPEGSLYPALHRLERGGPLESSWGRGGGRRPGGVPPTPARPPAPPPARGGGGRASPPGRRGAGGGPAGGAPPPAGGGGWWVAAGRARPGGARRGAGRPRRRTPALPPRVPRPPRGRRSRARRGGRGRGLRVAGGDRCRLRRDGGRAPRGP